ncbi:hypothetical protein ACOSQ3_010257 [Xanthoceras sorbifolium]
MDLLSKEGFLSKAKWIFSFLGGTILWASSRSQLSSMQISKDFALHHNCLQLVGLKTLVYLQGQPLQNSNPSLVINSYMIPESSSPLPSFQSLTLSSSSSYAMDDLLGSENGTYMNHSHEEVAEPAMNRCVSKQNQRRAITTREYPPPIPLLARTENLAGHMPWILTRDYSNGKLIIKEERVKHHQYFEAHREKGRLILRLVLLDDTVPCCHTASSDKNHENQVELQDLEFIQEENQENTTETADEDENGNWDNIDDVMTVVEETRKKGGIMILASQRCKTRMESWCYDKGYGALRKCFTYTGREISDTTYFCNGNPHDRDGSYFAHPGSAPLAFSMLPMATVM